MTRLIRFAFLVLFWITCLCLYRKQGRVYMLGLCLESTMFVLCCLFCSFFHNFGIARDDMYFLYDLHVGPLLILHCLRSGSVLEKIHVEPLKTLCYILKKCTGAEKFQSYNSSHFPWHMYTGVFVHFTHNVQTICFFNFFASLNILCALTIKSWHWIHQLRF